MKKRIVVALGHKALGTTLPEQKSAVKRSAEVLADIVEEGYQLAVCHSNAPQVGMIHTAMNEFGKKHPDYTEAPMSVCSAMSQGYIGYDLQNALQTALLKRGIYKGACTVLTQVTVDPYDEAFYHPIKVIGRYMTAEEADAEEKKGNYCIEEPGKGFRRIVAAPKPKEIVEIHHNQKVDAPSGTAKLLLQELDPDGQAKVLHGREGLCGKRSEGEIGVFSLRGGTVAGEHTVYFFGEDETLKLTHTAASRKIFVAGALRAAQALAGCAPGYYTLDELLFSQES